MVVAEDYRDPEGLYNGRLVAKMPLGRNPSAVVAIANMPADGSSPVISIVINNLELALADASLFCKTQMSLIACVQRRLARSVANRPVVFGHQN